MAYPIVAQMPMLQIIAEAISTQVHFKKAHFTLAVASHDHPPDETSSHATD
jgi:hypothetical protein